MPFGQFEKGIPSERIKPEAPEEILAEAGIEEEKVEEIAKEKEKEEEMLEKKFKKFKEVYKEYLKDQDLIIEIAIGANPGLYNKIRKNGFKKEYVGVNFVDTMPLKSKGLDYRCFDALDAERMNELIGDKETTIVSRNALGQVCRETKEFKEKDRMEEATEAFDKFHTNRFIHFFPTRGIIKFEKKEYQRFINLIEEKGWKATNLRIKEFYLKNYPDSDLVLLLEREAEPEEIKPEEETKELEKARQEIEKAFEE